MFDCAKFYGNEAALGIALKASGIPRDQFFIVSKVWTDAVWQGEEAIRSQVQQLSFVISCLQLDTQLKDLGVAYLDLYLIHWPVPKKHVEAYKTLEKLVDEGKTLSIGLSNYTIEDYEELRPHIRIPPLVNQFEVRLIFVVTHFFR